MKVVQLNQSTHSFTSKDFVIVMAGTNDILDGRPLDNNAISGLRLAVSNTNCFIVSVPYFSTRKELNVRVHNFNSIMSDCVNGFGSRNFKFIDINDIILFSDVSRKGIHLTRAEKRRLLFNISDVILKYFVINVTNTNTACNETILNTQVPNINEIVPETTLNIMNSQNEINF